MRREIERRLDLIGRVKHEPKLMPDVGLPETTNADTICRMQAMDDFKILGKNNLSYLYKNKFNS